jgi:hypothetical protein
MTWNWNWKLVVTGAAALTGVLGLGSPLQLAGPAAHPQLSDVPHAAAQVTAVAELEEQTRRLDERLTAAAWRPPRAISFNSAPVRCAPSGGARASRRAAAGG